MLLAQCPGPLRQSGWGCTLTAGTFGPAPAYLARSPPHP